MRARTIGQIASLIAEHMGGGTPAVAVIAIETTSTNEVDLNALSDADIDRLLGEVEAPEGKVLALAATTLN